MCSSSKCDAADPDLCQCRYDAEDAESDSPTPAQVLMIIAFGCLMLVGHALVHPIRTWRIFRRQPQTA